MSTSIRTLSLLILFAAMGHAQVSGSTTLTVTTSSQGSLLTGATVTSSNANCTTSPTISMSVPGGWTLKCAQSFEGGSIGPCEGFVQGASIGGTPHTGSHSMQGTYSGDGATVEWQFNPDGGCLGSYTTVYISYWDRTDTNGMFANSDYFEVELPEPGQGSGSGCWIALDAEAGSFTPLSSRTGFELVGGAPDAASGCGGNFLYNQGFSLPMDAGFWEQHEFLIKPSTTVTLPIGYPPPICTSPSTANCGNGTFEAWINGVRVMNVEDSNLNGTVNWNDGPVNVGGLITSFAADGTTRCSTFSATGGGTCPGTQPGTGAPPPFSRQIDDIIILVQ